MKTKFLFLVALTVVIFTGCKNDEPEQDVADKYVGEWNYKENGSIQLLSSGETLTNIPYNYEGKATITKKSNNEISIKTENGTTEYKIENNNIKADDKTGTENIENFTIATTVKSNGTLSDNIIVINENINGNWTNSGIAGNITGSGTITLTR